jgi:C4-dicarboxylate-specific signal transduction histidine kinase
LEGAIQQLKEAEAQLVEVEKLAALGRMSAGIIHEINNPLNYATTGLYSLRQRLAEMPDASRADMDAVAAEVEDGIKRVMNIVRDLRPFAGNRDTACDYADVRHAVDLALRFISHEYRDSVQMEVEVAPGLTAWANRVRLVQVLVNLLHNSLDALKESPPAKAVPAIWIRGWEEHGQCWLTLRDNGPGIPPDIQSKIFEPFFTTKEVGTGIGLGLHICHRIMQQHGGRIRVRSEPGQFCEFVLEFPTRNEALNLSANHTVHET